MQLIQNRWYVVLTSAELRADQAVGRRRMGLDMVFWRDASGRVAAAVDSCPHRRAKLSPGRVQDGCIECPFHGFRFDAEGKCTAIPAHPDRKIPQAMALDSFSVREEHDFVWLWTGPDPAPSEPIPFFDFSGHSWAGSQFEMPVASHYTRGIENQLDYAHLHFVHRKTIGRALPKRFEVACQTEGDLITASTGQADGVIEFRGPNIWRNRTGPMWQFLAFVPVDDEHMLYYVRSYQRMVTMPGVAWLFGRINRALNRVIMAEDTSVVESQTVIETRLRGMDEVLVPSDAPIIAYRRWRERHRGPFHEGARKAGHVQLVPVPSKRAVGS